jgi:pilus assembly protein CpaB
VSPRSLLVVVMALVFGGSAAVGVNSFVNNPPTPKLDVVPVVVAALDVPRGGNLTADMVKTRDYPRGVVPQGAVSQVQDAIDRAVFIPLLKDEPVLEAKLAPKGSGRGLAAFVPKGMRAFAIQTQNIATSVAGFILPCNKVDVLLTVEDVSGITPAGIPATGEGERKYASTTTLLQNVEILAVDQKTVAPAENKMDAKELRSVTLLVTPQQANELGLAQKRGLLHLDLRNLDDSQDAHTRPTTLSDLRFNQGASWDQRAKVLLEAWGKAMSQRKPEQKVVEAPKPPEPPPPTIIRTLRGVREGAVAIYVPATRPATPTTLTGLSPQAPKE